MPIKETLAGIAQNAPPFLAFMIMIITDPLRHHHRHCDDLFADAEAAANSNDWPCCTEAFGRFTTELESHFTAEEQILFPAFEDAMGMSGGPTQVMRMEHGQMRGLLEQMAEALQSRRSGQFCSAGETLLILMQQHNFKEENILYPMCDQRLAESDGLAERLREKITIA